MTTPFPLQLQRLIPLCLIQTMNLGLLHGRSRGMIFLVDEDETGTFSGQHLISGHGQNFHTVTLSFHQLALP